MNEAKAENIYVFDEKAQLKERLFKAEEAARNIQANSATVIQELRTALANAQERIEKLERESARAFAHLKRALPDLTATNSLTGITFAAADRIAVLRQESDEARDIIARAFTQLHVAFPDSPNDRAHLVGIAIHARDEINRLRADREAERIEGNCMTKKKITLREARDSAMKISEETDARLAEERRAELKAQLAEAKQLRLSYLWRAEEAEARAASALREKAEAVRLAALARQESEALRRDLLDTEKTLKRGQFAIAQLNKELEYQKHLNGMALSGWKRSQDTARSAHADFMTLDRKARNCLRQADADNAALREELKAARQVADAAVKWGDLTNSPIECMEASVRLQQAVRAYREQNNNQQPQGEQLMPEDTFMNTHEAQAASAKLEAVMKRRLDAILAEQPAATERMAPDDAVGRAQGAPQSPGNGPRINFQPDPLPLPTPATSSGQPITPETAPAGARILVKRRGSRYADPHEITIREWAPSGKRVLFYDRAGMEHWDEDLPVSGVLLETLPPSPVRLLAIALAKKTMAHLKGDGAEKGELAGLDTLLKDKPGAVATMENLDELAERREASGDEER